MKIRTITWLVILSFGHSSVSVAEPSKAKRILKDCVAMLGLMGAMAGRMEGEKTAADLGHMQFQTSAGSEAGSHFMGPLAIWHRLLGRRINGLSPTDALGQTFRYDYGFLLGYASIYYLLGRTRYKFFDIRLDDYEEFSNPSTEPRRVLMLGSVPPRNALSGFPEFYFSKRYWRNGLGRQNKYQSFENLDDLMDTLSTIERGIVANPNSKFDRVEFFFHGGPNQMLFEDGSKVGLADLQKALAGRNFKITTAGAEVRFISCSLAAGSPLRSGDTQVAETLGRALLPSGGKILASPRNIVVATPTWSWEGWEARVPTHVRAFGEGVVNLLGTGNFQQVWMGMLPSIWRNYKEAMENVIVLEVPAAGGE